MYLVCSYWRGCSRSLLEEMLTTNSTKMLQRYTVLKVETLHVFPSRRFIMINSSNLFLVVVNAAEPEAPKEEIRDWPQELLTIGTLGSSCTAGVPEASNDDDNNGDLQDCNGQHHLDSKTTLSLPGKVKGKDLLPDHQHQNKINKKSFKFLLKKAFVCNGGFSSPASPRGLTTDQLPPDSAMEKILKAILNKKIYPQNPAHPAAPSRKMYLGNRHQKKQSDCHDHHDKQQQQQQQTGDKGSKWDKTDSECE
ncbi:Protein DEEPER ROOTING 1 [Linum grandiflorum]